MDKSDSAYTVGYWNDFLPAGSPLALHEAISISHDGEFVVFDVRNFSTGQLHPVVGQINAAGMNTWSIDTIGTSGLTFYNCLASDIHIPTERPCA